MLVLSDAMSFKPEIFVLDSNGQELKSKEDSIRILGFYFNCKPTVECHVQETIRKVRRRYWILRHLKNHGMTNEELVQLEKLLGQSMKIIFGFHLSYRAVMEASGLQTLKERREAASLKFAKKCLDGNFHHWFPKNENRRTGRNSLVFTEKHARCNRLKNSPIYYMRRLLNENYTT
jgi:hypothetical protein